MHVQPTSLAPVAETEILALGRQLDAALPWPVRHARHAAEDMLTMRLSEHPQLRAALFRLVDVAPACRTPRELGDHLDAFLSEVPPDLRSVGIARRLTRGRAGQVTAGRAAAAAVAQMARRFIVAEEPRAAAASLGSLWRRGVCASIDLLGEATVTEGEADAYAGRCDATLVELARIARMWPAHPILERDSVGPLPRVNLSVKVTALTPLVRDAAPELGIEDAAARLRVLLRRARDLDAHLHVDIESMASRELIMKLVLDLLAEDEFRSGPSAGVVLQAYLTDSSHVLDQILDWTLDVDRDEPLTVRLVKGAYWDHEVVEARQHGWPAPVFQTKADTDRNYERLTRRLLDARPAVRVAIASHNLRSIAHAIAYNRASGHPDADLELQVLRGLGDDLQHALAAHELRVRSYCPVGDLVSGMAYLVRRLLENTANDSFLSARAADTALDQLLIAP